MREYRQRGLQTYVESSMKLVALEERSPEWVNHCGLIRCMIACEVPPDSACYYATMHAEGGCGLGWSRRVMGVVHGLGRARQLSGVGDAKFKVPVEQGSIKV